MIILILVGKIKRVILPTFMMSKILVLYGFGSWSFLIKIFHLWFFLFEKIRRQVLLSKMQSVK